MTGTARAYRSREAHNDAGLTLIEMVVALFLASLVLASFVGVAVAGAGASRAADARSRASQVGNAQVEQLKSTTWSTLGLYDNDTTSTGSTASNTCASASEPIVSLDTTSPTPRLAPALERTTNLNGQQYVVTSCVTWRDDSADGTQSAGTETDTDQGKDIKHLRVMVAWTLSTTSRSLTLDSVRAPTAAEVPLVSHSTSTLSLTAVAPSPSSQSLAADYSLSAAMTMTVTANIAATSVTVDYTGRSGAVTKTLTTGDGGTTWTVVIPSGSSGGSFNPGTTTFSVHGTSTSGSAQATTTASFSAPPTPFTVSAAASPSSVTLSSSGNPSSAVILTATTSTVASSVSVTFPVSSGSQTRNLTSSNGTTWTVTLPADSTSGPYTATSNELFTFTAAASSGSISATATITLTAAAAPSVVINSITVPYFPSGRICVKQNTHNPFQTQAIVVTANNVTVSDTATATWTSVNSGSTTYASPPTTSAGVTTFRLTIPQTAAFTTASTTITVTVKRTSTDGVAASLSQAILIQNDNGNGSGCT